MRQVLIEPWPQPEALRSFVSADKALHWSNSMACPVPAGVTRGAPDVLRLEMKLEMVHGYSG